MRIAVIADMHGNFDAFHKVEEQFKSESIGKLFILGDVVGYYYEPHKILKALAAWDYEIIKGNHEVMLAANQQQKLEIRQQYGSGIDIALKKLSKVQINNFKSMPFTKDVTIENTNFMLSHGSPWDYDCYVYPDDRVKIDKCFTQDKHFILVGHTHYPMSIRKGETVLLNPGSIGQSRESGGIAQWAIIDTDTMKVELKNTDYDISNLQKMVTQIDPDHAYLRDVLTRSK